MRAIAFTLVFACSCPAISQEAGPRAGQLTVGVEIPVAVQVPSDDRVTVWRSFLEVPELRLNLLLTNESNAPLWLDRGDLRNAIQFGIDRGGAVQPVSPVWLDEMLISERLPVAVLPNDAVRIEPMKSVRTTVSLQRTDGQTFGPGDYRITMDLRNVRLAVRDERRAMWNGRVPPDGQYHYIVRVQLPTSRAETAQRYHLEAEERVARDEFTAALKLYAQAAEAIERPDAST